VFGYRDDELLGQPVELLLPERFRAAHAEHRDRYRADPKVRGMGARPDLPARRKDGTEFLAEISLGPVHTDNDVLTFAVIRDVTERRRVEKALRDNQAQLVAARRIQQYFLPRSAPSIPGYDIAGASYPADFTAGDHFDYLPMAGATLGIVIGDVAGHGLGPSLLTVALHNHLRSLIEHHDELAEVLGDTNRLLCEEMGQECFITLLMGQLDPRARTFRYINAGHPSGYLLDAAGRLKARLDSCVLPLGILPELEFPPAESVALEPGDLLLLITDGVLEARAADGAYFGEERTLETVRANRRRSASEILDTLYDNVCSFSENRKILDDVTAVVVKVDAEQHP
jgi:PAS domain S-box-containing protein